jgi:hypothetical protein
MQTAKSREKKETKMNKVEIALEWVKATQGSNYYNLLTPNTQAAIAGMFDLLSLVIAYDLNIGAENDKRITAIIESLMQIQKQYEGEAQ